MYYDKDFEMTAAYARCKAEIYGLFTIVGEWNCSATVNISLLGSEEAFDCYTRYDLKSIDDFEKSFIEYIHGLLDEGWLNDYIQAGVVN